MTRTLMTAIAGFALLGCAAQQNDTTGQTLAPQGAQEEAAQPPAAEPTNPPQEAAPPAQQTGDYTDAQLRAFVAASEEIQPLTEGFAAAASDERERIATQIRAALDRNGINADTYNAIAAQAQTDAQLAQRIQLIRDRQQGSQESPVAPGDD